MRAPTLARPALVAQGIEHRPPEPGAKVRILPRAPPASRWRASPPVLPLTTYWIYLAVFAFVFLAAAWTTPPLVSATPVNVIVSTLRSHTMIVPHSSVSPLRVNGPCTAWEHDGLAMATCAALQPAEPRQLLMTSVGDVPPATAVLMHDC